MSDLAGIGVSPGAGVGPVRAITGRIPEPPAGQRHGGDTEAERAVALDALRAVAGDLEERGVWAADAGRPHAREMLAAQALMARDPALADDVIARIDRGGSAARSVFEAFAVYRAMLAGAGDYLAVRVADLDDVRDRTIARLLGLPLPGVPPSDLPFVLVARDLAPADTALLDPAMVVALVTEGGGPTTHTAILARALGVPAVVDCTGCVELPEGTVVLVDGAAGRVVSDPSEEQVAAASLVEAARSVALRRTEGRGATRDGHPVPLLANIGGPQDVRAALDNGAEGIGLYRTEFLFLDRAVPPTDAEQEEAYRRVLTAFPECRVIVRVLDAGADKPLRYLPARGDEPNPALGERGLRLLRSHPDVLMAQLAALVRAADGQSARLGVMAPMVTDAEEARFFAAACGQAGITSPGIMIEIPAAALRARDLVDGLEFFSIGTNDLAQYAYAADRRVGGLTRAQDPWQPALLDLAAIVATVAAETGKECGVCGEAAGDPALACVFVGLGATSLSMSAPALPLVRAALAFHTRAQCRAAADAARAAISADAARAAARAVLTGLADLGL